MSFCDTLAHLVSLEKERRVELEKETGNFSSRMLAGTGGMSLRRVALLLTVTVGLLVGATFGIRWLHYYFTHASTDDARVKGDLIAVSPTVQGKIHFLPIQEGDRVAKGQLIAQLREEDYQAQVDLAAGVVKTIAAELTEAEAELALVQAKTKEKAAKELVKENQVKLQVAQANAAETILKQQRVESLRGRLEEARAALTAAKLKREHTTVTSPIDGVVAKKVANIGEVIKVGQTIAVIVDLNNIWVEANLEETKLERVRLGQTVDVKVDAYPGTKFSGRVVNIGAAAASEFALIPENRSAGNFTKVTQRIPIKIKVTNPAYQLRPGMMVVVGIDIRKGKDGSSGALARENE
jgi:membrane fusion protein (multidrug efflux system)